MATPPQPEPSTKRSIWSRMVYNEHTDDTKDTRNVLLIVAALITTVTFQAGISPPGGVWQDDKYEGDCKHEVGRAIYSCKPVAFYTFLISNTLAFSTSILVLVSLTYRFPFQVELWGAILAMLVTFGASVFQIVPGEQYQFRYLMFAAAVPFVIRLLVEIGRWICIVIAKLFHKFILCVKI